MSKGRLPITLMALVLSAGLAQAQDPDSEVKRTPKASKEAVQGKIKARAAKVQAKAKAKAELDAKRVDINTATKEQLKAIPGLTEAQVDKIIAGRPYLTKAHLVTNQVLPEGVYLSIKDRIAVRKPGGKP